MVAMRGVSRTFQSATGEEVTILQGLDLTIEPGSFTVIRGESGSGKTTLLRILGMLDTGYQGEFDLGGMKVDGQPDWLLDELRSENIGFIFQEGRLFEHLDLLENVAVSLRLQKRLPEWEVRAAIDALAEQMFREEERDGGILQRKPGEVSGGQKQRASVMRAVANRPAVILADEPTASLHADLKRGIVELLRELQRQGHTVIVVSHDAVFYNEGRQLVLEAGKVRELGPDPAPPAEPEAPIPARQPHDGRRILWGWVPRAPAAVLFRQALREAFLRPVFLALILSALVVGVCQVAVFSSVILGTEKFIDEQMTQGSRLNRVEIKPLQRDLEAEERFPIRADIDGWSEVDGVVPRRFATITIVNKDGAELPYPHMGLHADDPEYRLLTFVAGGPFTGAHDQLEIIVTTGLLTELYDTSAMAAGKETFASFIGRPVEVRLPQFSASGQVRAVTPVKLRIAGVILHGEAGRQLYLPNTTLLAFDAHKRDRTGERGVPIDPATGDWSDMARVAEMADFPWEDKLQVYSAEMQGVIPVFRRLAQLGFRPESEIWKFKWALDIRDTAVNVFFPLLAMIVAVVSLTIFANIWTSSKLRERELALWRVLGMRRGDLVAAQVVATVLSVGVGALIGLVAGDRLIEFIRASLQAKAEDAALAPGAEPAAFDAIFVPIWGFSGMILAGAVVVALLAALAPAMRAAKVDPARVLRS
jgi:ABC-type lipoprotein export system ATPase subunit